LKLLGSNGESVSDKKVILSFEFPTHSSNTQLELLTNEQGLVHLGELKGCSWIHATTDEISESFEIDNSSKKGVMPDSVIGLEGEKLVIQNPRNSKLTSYFAH